VKLDDLTQSMIQHCASITKSLDRIEPELKDIDRMSADDQLEALEILHKCSKGILSSTRNNVNRLKETV